jgi:hypothetical protein
MKCGAPAEVHREKTFSWFPGWVYVLILVNLLVCLIVALILTKKKRVPVPLCHAHRNHWYGRQAVALLSFVGLVCVIVGAAILVNVLGGPRGLDEYGGWLCGASVVALVAWLIVVGVLQQTAIRPTEITDYGITLTNVSKEFVRAYKENRNVAGRIDELARQRWEGGRHRPPPRARDGDRVRRPDEDERSPPDTFQEG